MVGTLSAIVHVVGLELGLECTILHLQVKMAYRDSGFKQQRYNNIFPDFNQLILAGFLTEFIDEFLLVFPQEFHAEIFNESVGRCCRDSSRGTVQYFSRSSFQEFSEMPIRIPSKTFPMHPFRIPPRVLPGILRISSAILSRVL